MTANFIGASTVVHSVVVVRINGYKFRALLDSGASLSYASSTATKLIGASCKSVGLRQLVMLTGVTTRKMQVYDASVESVHKDFVLDVGLTKTEPLSLESRGGSVTAVELWWNGPTWLEDSSKWPPQIVTKASEVSDGERKVQRELSVVLVEVSNYLDTILGKFGLRKAMRFFGWVSRFIHHSRNPSKKMDGAMTTDKVLAAEMFWVKQTQQQAVNSEKFFEDKLQLNLQLNADRIWVCCGSLTRAVFLDLIPSLETKEFIKSFTRLIARRGRPSLIYSDNGSTIVAAEKWLQSVWKDEELNDLLRDYRISWRLNLSEPPGGECSLRD